jgi:hypothetical protein
MSAVCALCSSGSNQSLAGSTSCALCVAGRYQTSPGKSTCDACPGGKFVSTAGVSSDCVDCEAGHFFQQSVLSFATRFLSRHIGARIM